MKRLSFKTQFKIEFLLPFTGCRKVLEKIPEDSLSKLRETVSVIIGRCCEYFFD